MSSATQALYDETAASGALPPPDGTLVPPALGPDGQYAHGWSEASMRLYGAACAALARAAAVAEERARCARIVEDMVRMVDGADAVRAIRVVA